MPSGIIGYDASRTSACRTRTPGPTAARRGTREPSLGNGKLLAGAVGVAVFRDRSLAEQPFRYVFLDATYCKARVDHRVVSQAVVVATGVAADGRREVLGFDVGDSEDGAFWTAFLRV
jgi:Transposase, Mutator family